MSLASLRALTSAYRADPLLRYEQEMMSPPQARLHRSQARKRIIRACNRAGKTYAGAAEAWWHALGSHPFRPAPPAPNTGLILASDLKTGWSAISRALRELEPPGVLHPSVQYAEGVGYLYRQQKMIRLQNDSLIVGKGCEQSPLALESSRAQWGWVDEPPKPQHWSGLRTRLAIDLGPLWVTLTPIGRPVSWLRQIVEGDEETEGQPSDPGWDVVVATLTPADCPFRSRLSLQTQADECPPWEKAQRIFAEWEGYTIDRWITGFTDDCVFDGIPPGITEVALSWDHGERPGSSVCYLHGWDASKKILWTLAEWSNSVLTEPRSEVQEIVAMMRGWGVEPRQVSYAVGDSNSAGFLGVGRKVNEILEDEFALLEKNRRPPFEITTPVKGKGSVKIRARLASAALHAGQWRIHSSCTRLQQSFRHWAGKDDDLKHAFDSAGYAASHYLTNSLKAAKMTSLKGSRHASRTT